ncbi:MAG TPA: SPW repeat protein [Gammaproteobacteria bacterium]|nr:SPW repeat protein [Gammaproteobacteria bacterium]
MTGVPLKGMWKDWGNAGLGVWLAASPWLLVPGVSAHPLITYVCVPVGILLVAGGAGAASRPSGWTERLVVLLGLWLLVSPGTWIHRVPAVSWDNIAIGLAVLTLAFWRLRDLVRANRAR